MVKAKSKKYIIDMKTGFYNRRFFNVRLREERRRTERSGSPLSLLTLNISDLVDLIKKRPKLKIHQMKKVITAIVQENTRDIDIKSWHGDTTLKVLMPETPEPGAHVLAEKLREKVKDALSTFFGLKGVVDLEKSIMITPYPEITKDTDKRSKSEPLATKKSMATPPIRWGRKKPDRSSKKVMGPK
jgi:diguanylate cyclase (GGDEF)-like protein